MAASNSQLTAQSTASTRQWNFLQPDELATEQSSECRSDSTSTGTSNESGPPLPIRPPGLRTPTEHERWIPNNDAALSSNGSPTLAESEGWGPRPPIPEAWRTDRVGEQRPRSPTPAPWSPQPANWGRESTPPLNGWGQAALEDWGWGEQPREGEDEEVVEDEEASAHGGGNGWTEWTNEDEENFQQTRFHDRLVAVADDEEARNLLLELATHHSASTTLLTGTLHNFAQVARQSNELRNEVEEIRDLASRVETQATVVENKALYGKNVQ